MNSCGVEDVKLGLNVAAAFHSSENRRLLARLRADICISDNDKPLSNGSSQHNPLYSSLHSSKSNSHRKHSLDEYAIISKVVFAATFETATISVQDLRLSVGELLSIAFHDGIGNMVESLTIAEHERRKIIEDAAKLRVNELLGSKEWHESFSEVPIVSMIWPFEVLLVMIQCFKSNELVTDSLLFMWHAHSLNQRRLSDKLSLGKIVSVPAQQSSKEKKQSFERSPFFDEDLAVRISNRRRVGRSRLSDSVSENFGHHIAGMRARVSKTNLAKSKIDAVSSISTSNFADTRMSHPVSTEHVACTPNASVFSRLLQSSPRDRFLKLRKSATVTKQHHLLKIPEPVTPFVVQASVVAEVNALLLAPRFSGHSLGVWTLHKDFVSGEGLALSGSRTLRRGGKDVKRPATSDTTTTDHDAEEAKDTSHTRLNPNPDSSVHMDILEDAFKNRFA